MRRNAVLVVSICALLLLGGCSSPGSGPSGSPSVAPQPATSTLTTLNPCELVTAAEASTLTGATYADGTPESTGQGGLRCVYGSNTTNVFFVQVAQGANPAAAQAAWVDEKAAFQSALSEATAVATVNENDVTGIGDLAATVSESASILGVPVNGSGIYLIKGSNFLAFGATSNGPVPTADALKAQAMTSVARMP
jgi:hypothetical protein